MLPHSSRVIIYRNIAAPDHEVIVKGDGRLDDLMYVITNAAGSTVGPRPPQTARPFVVNSEPSRGARSCACLPAADYVLLPHMHKVMAEIHRSNPYFITRAQLDSIPRWKWPLPEGAIGALWTYTVALRSILWMLPESYDMLPYRSYQAIREIAPGLNNINIHPCGDSSLLSEGCITMERTTFISFMDMMGFQPGFDDDGFYKERRYVYFSVQ